MHCSHSHSPAITLPTPDYHLGLQCSHHPGDFQHRRDLISWDPEQLKRVRNWCEERRKLNWMVGQEGHSPNSMDVCLKSFPASWVRSVSSTVLFSSDSYLYFRLSFGFQLVNFGGRNCGSECQVSATWQWIPYHMLLGCTNESPSRSKVRMVRIFLDISCYFPGASIFWSYIYMNFLGRILWVLSISHISQFFWGSGSGKFSFSIWEEKHQPRSSNHKARIVARHCKHTYIVYVHSLRTGLIHVNT